MTATTDDLDISFVRKNQSGVHIRYNSEQDLLLRLSDHLHRKVVFLVGSALTMPKPARENPEQAPSSPPPPGRSRYDIRLSEPVNGDGGVPGTEVITGLICESIPEPKFSTLSGSTAERYQEAFQQLLARSGPDRARELLKNIVLMAWKGPPPTEFRNLISDEAQLNHPARQVATVWAPSGQ